jgi:hypothetical protein
MMLIILILYRSLLLAPHQLAPLSLALELLPILAALLSSVFCKSTLWYVKYHISDFISVRIDTASFQVQVRMEYVNIPTLSKTDTPISPHTAVALYFPTVYALDPHVGTTGVRLGIACLPVAVASLVGTPIAEALVGPDSHWWHGLAFAGSVEMAAAGLLAFACAKERRKLESSTDL